MRPSVMWLINCSLSYNLSVLTYAHTSYQISTSFLEEENPTCLKSRCQLSWILEHKLATRLFADQRLSYSSIDRAKGVVFALQSQQKSCYSGERKELPRRSVTLRSRDLRWRDLSTSSYYQAKILHTSTSALLSLGSISPPLRPFFHPCINSDTTFLTNQH